MAWGVTDTEATYWAQADKYEYVTAIQICIHERDLFKYGFVTANYINMHFMLHTNTTTNTATNTNRGKERRKLAGEI